MRCSILLAVSCAISAWAQTQPASQEDINRAVELLRKTPAVAPPPSAKPGVPIKVTTTTNAAPSLVPARPLVLPPSGTTLSGDMERRARELLQGTTPEPRTQPSTPAKEVFDRANAHDELRKQAIEETRRGLPQTAGAANPGTLAEEQQRKAQDEIDRQKNLERIEMEVQRAKLAREQKAAQAQAGKTNVPAPIIAATQTNAPAVAVMTTPTNHLEAATPLTSDQEAKARALLNELLSQTPPKASPAPVAPAVAQPRPAPKPTPAPVPVPPPAQAAAPVPVKPAPVVPAQPIIAPPEPKPVIVQQAPPPVVTPAPVPAVVPTPATTPQTSAARTGPALKGLAPDMEQRARGILEQVIANTKDASLPTLATQPPRPAPVIPPPQPQPEPQNTTVAPVPVRGPDAPSSPTVATPSKPVSAPISSDQESKARELLNQLTIKPAPVVTPSPVPTTPVVPTPTPVPSPQVARPSTQPAPVITPMPAPVISKVPSVTPTTQTEVLAPMPPDQEAKARALLNQTLASIPAPTPTTPPQGTVEPKILNEGDRRAQEDARRQAKLKAEIEDQTRREIARMEEESQARAREMAKRRMEEDKRPQRKAQVTEVAATPVAKPVVAAVRSTPEPAESKPAPAKTSEKPRRGKNDANSKAPAVVNEGWKDANKPREERLVDLLEAYRKDQISAQQYHSERAKILTAQQ